MSAPLFVGEAASGRPLPLVQLTRDLVALTKPRITTMVTVTTAGGIFLAPGRPSDATVFVTLLEVSAVVASACVLNGWLERDVDAKMKRTCDRPLAARRVPPWMALAFGLGLAAIGLPALAVMVNPTTALLTALAWVTYVLVYTPMKRTTPDALLVGAIPGALPPLIGWTAATGTIDAGGLALFSLMFVWQLPHFLAIALYLADDYARGGIRVLPLTLGPAATARRIVGWAVLQLAVSVLPWLLGILGTGYLVVALGGGLVYLGLTIRGLGLEGPRLGRWARSVMLASVAWLTLVFAAIGLGAS